MFNFGPFIDLNQWNKQPPLTSLNLQPHIYNKFLPYSYYTILYNNGFYIFNRVNKIDTKYFKYYI